MQDSDIRIPGPRRDLAPATPLGRLRRLAAGLGRQVERLPWPGDADPASRRAGPLLDGMAALPFAGLDAVTGGAVPLVLAPHPDDESLGCGGLIAACCAAGTPPLVVVLTDGALSHPGSRAFPPERLVAARAEETAAAVAALGLARERLHFLGLPDGAAPREGPAMEAAAARLADLARRHGTGCLLTTWEHDPHPDHVAAAAIARQAARQAGLRLVAYPVWGWALPRRQRVPVAGVRGVRLDIARHLPAKRRAIAAHASQHGALVADDPGGFRLPAELLAMVDRPFEVFLFDR